MPPEYYFSLGLFGLFSLVYFGIRLRHFCIQFLSLRSSFLVNDVFVTFRSLENCIVIKLLHNSKVFSLHFVEIVNYLKTSSSLDLENSSICLSFPVLQDYFSGLLLIWGYTLG